GDDGWGRGGAFGRSTRDQDGNFEAMTAELGALPPPSGEVPQAPAPDTGCDRNGFLALPTHGRSFSELFGSIRVHDYAKIYAGSTFWWTIGGEGITPVALSGRGMPDPFVFSAMLTGELAASPALGGR